MLQDWSLGLAGAILATLGYHVALPELALRPLRRV